MTRRQGIPDPAGGSGWEDYRRLLCYVVPHWKLFLVVSLIMMVYSSTDAMFAALMKPMLDEGFVARDPAAIRLVPILLVLLFVFRGITGFVSNYGMNWIGRKVVEVLRGELFRQLVSLPSRYFDRASSGELVSRLIYHVEQVAQASTNAVTILIRDTFTVLFLLIWMFIINGWLALLFLVVGPVMAYLIRNVSQRLRRISGRIQDSMGDVTHLTEEAVLGQEVIKAFGAQRNEIERFDAVNSRNRSLQMRMIATNVLSVQLVQLMGAATFALVIYLASRHADLESVTAGDFVSFITAMMLLMPPLKRLTSVNASLQRGIAAAGNIFDMLDAQPEKDTGRIQVERVEGGIEFRDVCFVYTGDSPAVLDGVGFTVEPGETLAIVGRSGSGKSTLVNLIPRFYEPGSGEIRLDGTPIQEYTLESLRAQIAMVGQDVILFNDTVAGNIAYGRTRAASREEIEAAARLSHAMDFIQTLPQGLDTPVGERGNLLSGGQRQRLAIARALLKDAPILILDEATSALDTESERAIQSALEHLMQGRTTLVIAHRLSTVERADRILVLDQGRVVESGRHEELLAREGHYAALYRMQFSDPRLVPEPMRLERLWYEPRPVALLGWPLAFLYCSVVRLRRLLYRLGWPSVQRLPVPVIVVGNLTVGGTGKTPLVGALVEQLRARGYRPGLVARGYGGHAASWPQQVRPDSDPRSVGDEPILLVRRTGCPMAVGPDRVAAARAVLAHTDCDILVSDDGLQHYALGRDLEILVVDGIRRFGNRMCLPAGPLREPLQRLQDVDMIVCNGVPRTGELGMQLRMTEIVNVHNPDDRRSIDSMRGLAVTAVAGIGYPQRFFEALTNKGISVEARAFPDHHDFTAADLAGIPDTTPILMTEKDAVKCLRLERDNLWYVAIRVELDPRFESRLQALLEQIGRGRGVAAPGMGEVNWTDPKRDEGG